jgi:hypothetical protein
MSVKLGVISRGNKFVVIKNGEPILLPKSNGQTIVTEFDSKEDAERYIGILNRLSQQKKYA